MKLDSNQKAAVGNFAVIVIWLAAVLLPVTAVVRRDDPVALVQLLFTVPIAGWVSCCVEEWMDGE